MNSGSSPSPEGDTFVYSPAVLDHSRNPRNQGDIRDPHGVGVAKDEFCRDSVKMSVQIIGNIIVDVRFRVQGCPATRACASMTTVLAIGGSVEEGLNLKPQLVEKALGELPPHKKKAPLLSVKALTLALENYLQGGVNEEEGVFQESFQADCGEGCVCKRMRLFG